MTGPEDVSPEERRIAPWMAMPFVVVLLPLAIARVSPWNALLVFLLVTTGMGLMSVHWYRVRNRQLIPDEVLREQDLALRGGPIRQATARVTFGEKRRFIRLAHALTISGVLATANTLVVVLAPFESMRFPTAYVRAVTPRGAMAASVALYFIAATAFVSLRVFIDNRNLIAYRDSTKAGEGATAFVVEILMLTRARDHPGEAFARTALFAALYIIAASALVMTSPNLNADVLPPRTEEIQQVAKKPPASGTSPTSATPTTTARPTPTSNASTETSSIVAPTTAPSAASETSCDGVRSLLIASLPTVVNVSVAREYSNHYRDLQCVRLDADGHVSPRGRGAVRSIEFGAPHEPWITGAIVFNQVGDAATLLAGESTFAEMINAEASVYYVTPLISIHGAQLRLATRADSRCFLELRPDSNSDWTAYTPDIAPAILTVFLGRQQLGRPLAANGFRFAYPSADVTISTNDAHEVVAKGADPALAKAASSADRCISADTLRAADLDGPPAS